MPGNGTQGRAVASRQSVCPGCYNLDRDRLTVSSSPNQFPTLSRKLKQLVRAGKKGCQICYAIKVGMLLMLGLDPRERKVRFDVCVLFIELSDIVRVFAGANYTDPQGNLVGDNVSFELFTKPEKPSPWPAFGPANEITPTLHSRRRQKMMRGWIEKCTASHPTCRAVQGSAPRRCLDLGKDPRNGVKLVDTSASPGPYVAIMHGVAGPLPVPCSFTTAENLEERQRRIAWWQIPVALQEALTVANEQGVRYAWIPDFCVLHGDVEDYNWHLDREDAIFRHAHFTIALAGTTDLRLSNFRPVRKATADGTDERAGSRTIQISHHGRTYPIQVRPSMHWSYWIMADIASLEPMATKTHLFALSRHKMGILRHAPSFQRLLLSPRVLHLHRAEMAWDCLEGSACECGDEHYLNYPDKPLQPLPRERFHTMGCIEDLGHVLQMYMKLPLSQPDQRLVHMTGMLRHISQVTGKRYCAAIPASSPRELAEELLWNLSPSHDMKPVTRSHRHHTPCIPTWSWASMVLADDQVIQSAASILYGVTLAPLVLSPSFHFWDARCTTAPGSSGDGLLASEYQLEVSANVVRGRVRVPPEQSIWIRGAPHLLFTPETAPGEIPWRTCRFQLDCEGVLSSVKSSQGPVTFYFMSLGEMTIKEAAVDPLNIDESISYRADVGVVLRRSQRDYALGFERVGVFGIPKGFYSFADFDVQRLVLV
ncbi:hypothetical protein CGRA01v4_12572 [Colletotrichum graminicola]|uniref:Heterokaryon incompatibility domain-containing protein n=1 Tax=Colletotrichum graminicola (strain M1.001 / M2 / FGSC 10212) TaxID=645133 RepID=E3QIG4_COLGM|nr:uncharacterized protein GLRG_05718 [Colletotrichum graminicola M1.001]EFQ30574.1 hypothetical protein GLRG_05718 [Colletotrichum graminicola M1.001]WDK21283.1 hypothetical protein CGRA01v4_12572 [Colletotrichum graminicola]